MPEIAVTVEMRSSEWFRIASSQDSKHDRAGVVSKCIIRIKILVKVSGGTDRHEIML